MTDKQIIIDGVDVSKCKYYKEYSNPNEDGDEYNDICECSITESAFCFDECNSNCYFKNWQRKEQECEFSNLRIIQLQETLSQYETDLSTKDCIVETCKAQYKELKAENDLFRTCHDNEQAKRRKFEQCLTEIKEIAEPYQKEIIKICGNCNDYDDCHACCKFDLNCYQYKKGDTKACDKFIELKKFEINNLANKILQKINECEVDK